MFSFLTEPNYPKAAIGLEKESITALSVRREGGGRFGIQQAATVQLPINLLTPNFIERNIASPEEFRVVLEEAVVSAGLANQRNWSVSLPGNSARTGILTLENTSGSRAAETSDILDWKAEQSFGAPSGELRITTQKISNDAEGRSRYFATAVKLSVIDEYETIFEGLGWKAGLILPRAVSESKWLMSEQQTDTLLLSSQTDGFTALLLRDGEPAVVRSVTCAENEVGDEIYRLLMFYHDRFAGSNSGLLERILVIGRAFVPDRIKEISQEALGRALHILRADDIGLSLPVSSLSLDDVAAPAGLAALGYR
jgi:hypothetical protein